MKPTAAHLAKLRKLWALNGEPEFVRKVENWIYVVKADRLYLRLTEPAHRDRGMLEAELDWMAHLRAHGARLAPAVRSTGGRYVEEVGEGDATFFASAIREAPGRGIGAPDDFTPARMRNWGRVVAQLHVATKSYVAPPGATRRPQWNEEHNYMNVRALARPSDGALFSRFGELDAWLGGLPKGAEGYGLVHADVHPGNFFVDDADGITVFDFDDCHYHWFAYDIAVPLYLLALMLERKGAGERYPALERKFWEGYSSVNALAPSSVADVPRFLVYRNLVMYYWCVANLENPDLDDKAREWMSQTMARCRVIAGRT